MTGRPAGWGPFDAMDWLLDRSVLAGYANVGLFARRLLPGWPADPPRMDGKVVLVTGAAAGLGLGAAIGFARLGASVRVLGRDPARAAQAAQSTLERVPEADVVAVSCDLSEPRDLREFIAEFCAREARLDVLVNNAGLMPSRPSRNSQGVELMFATHVLAPWALIAGLRPLLEAAAPARVINVSSGGQYTQRVPAGYPFGELADYRPARSYARSKRALVLIGEQWADRLAGTGIHVHAMHPGWADTPGVRVALPGFRSLTGPLLRNVEQGADTVVWLGSCPQALETSGLFWHDRRPRPATHPAGPGREDPHTRAALWDAVVELAAESLPREADPS